MFRFTQWSAYAFLRRPIRSEKPPRRSGAAIHADRFTDKVLPEFRERQVALALEGRGMFAARGGLQNERELRAAAHQSRGGGRGGGGDGRGGTGRTRAELNPSLSINRPEVKRALSAAAAQRRHQSHRTLSGATPGNLLRR